ncbi:Drug resistance [Hyphodiscus hymeniophilus]|uniref:Drug resistance n=1 Tax=Hyphodiscus hymeniophilus TaxID=353542 RepID=A0A9P6VFF6_9HELO|nr:Drug resistance [Hyphodiscus hymeniophilus]
MDEEKELEPRSPTGEDLQDKSPATRNSTSPDPDESNDALNKEMEVPSKQNEARLAPTSEKDVQDPMKPDMSLPHEIAFVAVICMAQLLTQTGLSMALSPLFIIGDSFGVHADGDLSWFAAAYSLTVGTFILPAGRLGDVYGHKKVFVLGWLCFSIFSLLAGFSVYVMPGTQGSKFFSVMRALQGIGPAVLLPNAIALLGRTYQPGKRKNMVFSLFGATAPAGGTTGLVFSGLLAELAWWPWAFWILAIVTFLMAILSLLVVPRSDVDVDTALTESHTTWKSLWAHLDANGTITGVIGLVLINIAWNQAPAVGWPTPYVYVLLIIGVLFMGVFFYIEHTAPHPLIPLRNIGRDVGFVLGCIAFGWSSFGIWFFYLLQMLLVLRHHTPLLSAAQFTPPILSGLCAAIVTGLLLHKVGPGVTMMISMVAFCTGNILLATMPVNQIYWAQTFVSLVITPWGMDMSFPSATIILSNSMPREHQGMAASLVTTVVNYSISLGLGFAGTVQSRILANGGNTLDGFRSAWYVGIGMAGLGIVVAVAFNVVGVKEVGDRAKTEESDMSP